MHNDENDNTIVCHMGTRVRKNHTSRRGAFQTVGGDPAFVITDDMIQRNVSKKFFKTREFQPRINIDTRIALVKYHPGYDPKLVDDIIDGGYKGIIFEGDRTGTCRKSDV